LDNVTDPTPVMSAGIQVVGVLAGGNGRSISPPRRRLLIFRSAAGWWYSAPLPADHV